MDKSLTRACVALIIAICCAESSTAAPVVVETDPLTPDQQRLRFHLPPGFEIQLVVSEPDIGQPMNMSFDAAGRLWVTHSVEYPYPARGEGVEPRDDRFQGVSHHQPRDRLTVLSGIGPGGRPEHITHFRSDLNIPIGNTPARDGAIVFSIPHIWICRDNDGDGIAEQRDQLYGTFGNVDTHGMTNSFTRWIDGWIYACHGFRNTSTVTDAEGHSITMNSGNTYRFREDGSRIEQITWGQVNPFGLTFDPWGNEYSADCHSRPLTCLIRDGYYSSFGKPHDGLGFAPDMIEHDHGSTGICGAQWYAARQFPSEYQGSIFLCNPVTGQVQRDRIDWRGSSPWAIEQPEFVTCDDGWFRPVDVQLGPDGALYIADFYNAIIGHYEAPLDHPRRDREKGRIWRIVYTGAGEGTAAEEVAGPPDMTRLNLDELVDRLADPNITVRTLATNLLDDRFAQAAAEPLRDVIVTGASPEQRSHAAWLLFRLEELDPFALEMLAGDQSPIVRTHVARILSETLDWRDEQRILALRLLADPAPMVRRAAAAAIARQPSDASVSHLINTYYDTPEDDTHLRHTLRIALRNQLAVPEIALSRTVASQREEHSEFLSEIALGAPTPEAAALIAAHLSTARNPNADHARFLKHVARFGKEQLLEELTDRLRAGAHRPPHQTYADLLALTEGLELRGKPEVGGVASWAEDFVNGELARAAHDAIGWVDIPLAGFAIDNNGFALERRPSADGNSDSLFFSTWPKGEQQTGLLRSDTFELPRQLTFFMAGHSGFPDKPAKPDNQIRLLDAETNQVLLAALPPRHDTARLVKWDLADHAGKTGYLEILDRDTGTGFAWLAVGRFSIPDLNPRTYSPTVAATNLVIKLRLTSTVPTLKRIVSNNSAPLVDRLRCAQTLLTLRPDARLAAVLGLALTAPTRGDRIDQVLAAIVTRSHEATQDLLKQTLQSATASTQNLFALSLSGDSQGAHALLEFVEAGLVSPRVLTDPAIAERVTTVAGPKAAEQIAALTQGIPSPSEEIDRLISERRAAFSMDGTSPQKGRALLKKHCAACHQFAGQGKKVGPQLDGIGGSDPDRLLQDIHEPHRTLDAAFPTPSNAPPQGQVLTGLKLREEGETIVIADNKGEEIRIAKSDIDEQSDSRLSLMPSNLGETIPADELQELLAELLRSVTKPR